MCCFWNEYKHKQVYPVFRWENALVFAKEQLGILCKKYAKRWKVVKSILIEKLIHVDEFTARGKEEGKQGRSYDTKKKKAVIAVALTDSNKVKRVYIKSIKDYSTKSLTPIFEEHISASAKIITDKWRGYEPLKEIYDIEQIYSNNGANFKQLHSMIMQA